MEQSDVPKEFFDAVDEFINLANSLSRKWPTSRISSAIMYAAARYNAFNFYTLEPNPERNARKATKFLCKQYKAMLLENLVALEPSRPCASPNGGRASTSGSCDAKEAPPSVR